MSSFEVKVSPKKYDAVIVGSGAGGFLDNTLTGYLCFGSNITV
jgi:hypothetical protein